MRHTDIRHAVAAAFAVMLTCVLWREPVAAQTADLVWRSGVRLERRVAGAGPDTVRIPLAAGQFVRIEVMQNGSDLRVALREPGSNRTVDVDAGNARFGPETIATITEVAGDYMLEVRKPGPPAEAAYSLTVRQLRAATEADRATVEAFRSYDEGSRLVSGNAEQRRRAIARLGAARDYFGQAGETYMEGLACLDLGVAYARDAQFRTAIPLHEKAAALFRAVGDPHGEAAALNNQAGTLDVLGETPSALRLYKQAGQLAAASGDRPAEGLAKSNAGTSEGRLLRWQEALDDYRQALPLLQEAGDRRRESVVLINMGITHEQLGDSDAALRLFGDALVIVREIGDKPGEASILAALAEAGFRRGEPRKSLDYASQALALWRGAGDRRREAQALHQQGRAFDLLGRRDEALDAFGKSAELAVAVGDRRSLGQARLYRATAFSHAGDWARAVAEGEAALAEFRTLGDRGLEGLALETLARAESAQGRLREARRRMEESLIIGESSRQGTDSQQLRASFFAMRQDAYTFYIDLTMRLGGEEALALETSERSRARSLLEMLAAPGTDIREGVDPKLLAREREVSDLLNARGSRLLALAPGNPLIAVLTREVHELESEYQDLQTSIRRSSPRYAAVTQPQVLTAKQIQTELLDNDTLLLEYSLGEENSYLFVVDRDSLRSVRLPPRATIEERAIRVAQMIAVRAPAAELEAAAGELSRMVFGEGMPALGKKRLVIVPDGALQSVPFAMLPEPGAREPLVVDHEIVMTPSASSLAALRSQGASRKPATKTLAVFADPVFDASDPRTAKTITAVLQARARTAPAPTTRVLEHLSVDGVASAGRPLRIARLPYTAREAEKILRVKPNSSDLKAVGFSANRATAIGGELSAYRFLHFATHGYLDTERPELSALVLSQVDRNNRPEDGFLRVNDIYNARLSAELAVLSACQTGLGKAVRGEGLMGLTRAFLYAGVPKVIVSLWNVNDRATAELMAAFYENMLRRGQRPSEALRGAQLELRKQKKWESPYYWAAFVQQGDWR